MQITINTNENIDKIINNAIRRGLGDNELDIISLAIQRLGQEYRLYDNTENKEIKINNKKVKKNDKDIKNQKILTNWLDVKNKYGI